MGLFTKTVPDGVWATVVADVYKEAAILGEAFSASIREESLRGQFDSASEILRVFPGIRYSLKLSANPSSSEAKQAKKISTEVSRIMRTGLNKHLSCFRM